MAHHLAASAVRAAALFLVALAAMPVLRRRSAATRRLVLVLAFAGALVLPAATALLPSMHVATPANATAIRARHVVEPLVVALSSTAPSPAATASRGANDGFSFAAALSVVWAAGALAIALRFAAGAVRTARLVRRAQPLSGWDAVLARASAKTGTSATLRATTELDAPAVAGILRPVVLVPVSAAGWTDERRFAVLVHELAHVAHRDLLAQLVAYAACALHWFDPLAWLALRRLRIEREIAADDAVVLAGARASSYAADLLAIATDARSPGAVLAMAERSTLGARVASIVAAGRARALPRREACAVLAAVSLATALAACATAATEATPSARAAARPSSTTASSRAADYGSDERLEAIANEELTRTMEEWRGAAGVALVLDPRGRVLASAGRIASARADVARTKSYVTGSTLKTVTLAAALEERVVDAHDTFDCENGARSYGAKAVLRDAGSYGTLSLAEILAVSSNVGIAKVYDRLGGARMATWLGRFGFANAPQSLVDRSYEGALTAIGETMTATPLEVASAYAVVANDGVDGAGRRVITTDTARMLTSMLETAVAGERATGKLARVEGSRVAGKTGTAEWTTADGREARYASFVGFVPADRPRFVVLVGVESPKDGAPGGHVAAPAFARIAARALAL